MTFEFFNEIEPIGLFFLLLEKSSHIYKYRFYFMHLTTRNLEDIAVLIFCRHLSNIRSIISSFYPFLSEFGVWSLKTIKEVLQKPNVQPFMKFFFKLYHQLIVSSINHDYHSFQCFRLLNPLFACLFWNVALAIFLLYYS